MSKIVVKSDRGAKPEIFEERDNISNLNLYFFYNTNYKTCYHKIGREVRQG